MGISSLLLAGGAKCLKKWKPNLFKNNKVNKGRDNPPKSTENGNISYDEKCKILKQNQRNGARAEEIVKAEEGITEPPKTVEMYGKNRRPDAMTGEAIMEIK